MKLRKHFWLRHFAGAFVLAWVALAVIHGLKGFNFVDSLKFGVFWGFITAAIFTGVAYFRYRRYLSKCRRDAQ